MAWLSMDTAPKGGGGKSINDPNWVDPPAVLLLYADGNASVGKWDWYYAEGGRGYQAGILAWIDPITGDPIGRFYSGDPIGWLSIPPP